MPPPPAPVEMPMMRGPARPKRSRYPEVRLRDEALTAHHLCNHKPFNPFCIGCRDAKSRAQQARRRDIDRAEQYKEVGDLLLADHIIMRKEEDFSFAGEETLLPIKDVASGYKETPL